jgi:Zn-dependent protease with chaperone function
MAPAEDEVWQALWPRESPPPVRTVACRHCRQRNRVEVPRAVMQPEWHDCGACGRRLFLAKDEPLVGLAPEAYQHCLDKRSVAALGSVPGVPALVEWVLASVGDRTAQIMFMADTIQCSAEQFPELIALVDRARARLDIEFRPTVYLGESPHMNALTTGVNSPVIVVQSALLDQMRDDEVLAILGHELGHLHAGHPLYQGVANVLLSAGTWASPALRLASLPIQRLLLRWLRHAELTADRAALLASRDLPACINVMLTFAGGNRPGTARRTHMRLGPFVRQCRELASWQATRPLDSVLGTYVSMDRTHPHVAARVVELIRWVEYGSYLNILGGQYLRRADAAGTLRLPEARAP